MCLFALLIASCGGSSESDKPSSRVAGGGAAAKGTGGAGMNSTVGGGAALGGSGIGVGIGGVTGAGGANAAMGGVGVASGGMFGVGGTGGIPAQNLPPISQEEFNSRYAAGQRDFGGMNLAGVDFANTVDLILQGANLEGTTFAMVPVLPRNLRGARLDGACLRSANAVDADMEGASLRGVFAASADFRGANLHNADLSDAILSGSTFADTLATLDEVMLYDVGPSRGRFVNRDANASGANLTRASMRYVFIYGGTLEGANLTDAAIASAEIRGTNLSGATLNNTRVEFTGLDALDLGAFAVTQSSFRGSRLKRVVRPFTAQGIRQVQLEEAQLLDSTVTGADWSGLSWPWGSFTGTTLANVRLDGAFLYGSDFSGVLVAASLLNADLRGAKIQTSVPADVAGAWYDSTTQVGTTDPRQSMRLGPSPITPADLLALYTQGERAFPGIVLANAKLTGANLEGVNLQGTTFDGLDLSGGTLTSAILYRAKLVGAILRGVSMRQAQFSGANLMSADLSSADAIGANFERAVMESVVVSQGKFTGANFGNARARFSAADGDFSAARFQMATLEGNLQGSNFSMADMREADVQSDDATGALFVGANLRGARLSGFLRKANFSNADLQGARLSGDFSEAILDAANLSCTDLTGSIFDGADLSRSNLRHAQLTSARYSALTKFPPDFDPVASGMVLE